MSGDDVEKDWVEFWAPIVAPSGVVDLEAVKRELFDFHTLMRNAPRVYMAATGDLVSKPMTDPGVVIGLIEESRQQAYDDGYRDAVDDAEEETT